MREERLFLMRLWRNGAGSKAWRVSLENLRTKEKIRFADIKALLVYLKAQTQEFPVSG
jgi:hypothetical protein